MTWTWTLKTTALAGGIALLFMALVLAAVLLEERQDTERMKACVAAGGDWVRDFGSVYECEGVDR